MSLRVVSYGDLDRVPEHVDAAAQEALVLIGAEAHEEIVGHIQNTPDERGHKGRSFTGRLGQSIQARFPERTATGWSQETLSTDPNLAKAAVMEYGRRPGFPVSAAGRQALDTWVRRKLQIGDEKERKRTVYVIARAIKRRGIPALRAFGRTREALAGGRAQAIYRQTLAQRMPK